MSQKAKRSGEQVDENGFSPEQQTQFSRDGFVVARGLLDTQRVAELRSFALEHRSVLIEPIEYEVDVHYPGSPRSRSAPGGDTPRRLLQAYERHEKLADCAHDRAVALRLRQLVGGSRIWLTQSHHNCVMTKCPAYSSDTGWHRDVRYWSFANRHLVNAWFALCHEYAANGGLRVIPGSHLWTGLRDTDRLDTGFFLRPDHPANLAEINNAVDVELSPGDVLFFHAAAFHSASRNHTDEIKYSIVFSYHGADNWPEPDSKSTRYPEIEI